MACDLRTKYDEALKRRAAELLAVRRGLFRSRLGAAAARCGLPFFAFPVFSRGAAIFPKNGVIW